MDDLREFADYVIGDYNEGFHGFAIVAFKSINE